MVSLISILCLVLSSFQNVLLPNSDDGWWTFKNYCPSTPDASRTWESRKSLMAAKIASASPDIVCLQEASERSYETDFDFLDSTHSYLVGDKGRMRCMTFYRKDRCEKIPGV